jgi:hypothetical protein
LGYEPNELPTAPSRGVVELECKHTTILSIKTTIFVKKIFEAADDRLKGENLFKFSG